MIHDELAQLVRFPQRDDVWQLGQVRLPTWVETDPPCRPRSSACASAETGLIEMGDLVTPGEPNLWDALLKLVRRDGVRFRPAIVQVRDDELAARLRPALAESGIFVEAVDALGMLDDFYRMMRSDLASPVGATSHLDGRDVDLDRVRAFAVAAAAFHAAAPWEHLSDLDRIEVETPVPEGLPNHVVVLGNAGVVRGLGFHRAGDEDHEAMSGGWLFSFDDEWKVPIGDSDLWAEHQLPLARPGAFPLFASIRGRGHLVRASAAELGFVEALLRTLAASTEDEFDAGRWTRTVATHDGAQTITLSLPSILAPRPPASTPGYFDRRLMERSTRNLHRLVAQRGFESLDEINQFLKSPEALRLGDLAPETPEDRANELVHRALETQGRLRVKLAREALREWPDCADAYVILAEESASRERAEDFYRRGILAGERALGAQPFADDVGHFWGILETRPYMRARFGLAQTLWVGGRHDEAVEHWIDLLRLNPGDNQGVRMLVIPRLLGLGRDAEARRLLDEHSADGTAMLAFCRALSEFRRTGDSGAARAQLRRAQSANPHVVKHLLAAARPEDPTAPHYRLGGEDEAAMAAHEIYDFWVATPGAREWLRQVRIEGKKAREKKRKGRR